MDVIVQALEIVTSGHTPLVIPAGVCVGIVLGIVPGIGAVIGMAIALPLTITLSGPDALLFLITIYSGAQYGGCISAILLNVPGTSGAAATTLDGYPMSKQGRAAEAIAISATSSAGGGLIATLTLFLAVPVLMGVVLLFQSPDYFLIAILGLAMISVVARGSLVKGLTVGTFGLLLSTVGTAPTTADRRFAFDSILLYDGLEFVAIIIGVFAISEMLKLSTFEGGIAQAEVVSGGRLSGFKTVVRNPITFVKSTFIGLFVGALPGAGAAVANFVSYGEAVRSAKDKSRFGKGDPRGVIAAESADNAMSSGALVPTLSFGIPGSAATAVLLGGLLLHGLNPGPSLFDENLHVTYALLLGLVVANVLIFVIGISSINVAGYITKVDTKTIIPIVVVLTFVGAYSLRQNWVDVFTVVVMGFLGYVMVRHNYSLVALILGVILGPTAEANFLRSLNLSGGSYAIFVENTLSKVLVIAIVLLLAAPLLGRLRARVLNE